MALRSTEPLTNMRARNLPGRKERPALMCQLWADCLEYLGVSTSHRPTGLQGLLQEYVISVPVNYNDISLETDLYFLKNIPREVFLYTYIVIVRQWSKSKLMCVNAVNSVFMTEDMSVWLRSLLKVQSYFDREIQNEQTNFVSHTNQSEVTQLQAAIYNHNNSNSSVALVHYRTIPTERPTLVGKSSCQLLLIEGFRVVSAVDPLRMDEIKLFNYFKFVDHISERRGWIPSTILRNLWRLNHNQFHLFYMYFNLIYKFVKFKSVA
jgi:hypothetical protein